MGADSEDIVIQTVVREPCRAELREPRLTHAHTRARARCNALGVLRHDNPCMFIPGHVPIVPLCPPLRRMVALLSLAVVAAAAGVAPPPTPDNLQDLPIAADSIVYLDGT